MGGAAMDQTRNVQPPDVSYARSGEIAIAYQVVDDGQPDGRIAGIAISIGEGNPGRGAHAVIIGTGLEDWERAYSGFERVSIPAPSLDVDTTDGYTPALAEIVEFVNRS
jgi:hypothetical protein